MVVLMLLDDVLDGYSELCLDMFSPCRYDALTAQHRTWQTHCKLPAVTMPELGVISTP